MSKVWARDSIESPCVNICQMHPVSGLCIGCLRSLDEIATWGGMSAQARAQVMEDLPERRGRQKNVRRGGRARNKE